MRDYQVLGFSGILKDTIEQLKANIREYLQKFLPVDTIFVDLCLANHRILIFARHVLKRIGVNIKKDRKINISIKFTKKPIISPKLSTWSIRITVQSEIVGNSKKRKN